MNTFAWLTSKISGVPPPDPEVERAKRRNEMRDFGLELRTEREELMAKRVSEESVYRQMLGRSGGRPDNAFYKQAVIAKKNIVNYDKQIAAIDARLRPIEQVLEAAKQRQTDTKFQTLMKGVVVAERNAPAAASREEIGELMGEASEMVNETLGMERDMNALDLGGVQDLGALDAEMANDFALFAAEGAATTSVEMKSTARATSLTNEDLEARAIAAAIRNPPPVWAPPSQTALSFK